MNVLIIEDNIHLAHQIKKILEKNTFANRVEIVQTYESFYSEISNLGGYDIILVDIFLGDKRLRNGIDILKEIREKQPNIPVVMVTSISDCSWMKKAFEYGATDYIIKPFRLAELVVRAQKWFSDYLKCKGHNTENNICYNGLEYCPSRNEFFFQGKFLKLSKKSKYVLCLFLLNPEKLVQSSYLYEKIWGDRCMLRERNARIIILRLKKTLHTFGIHHWIQTIHGEGYILRKV